MTAPTPTSTRRRRQFEGAERIAAKWGITRQLADALGCESQRRAAVAWAEDRFAGQIVPLKVATYDEDGRAQSAR